MWEVLRHQGHAQAASRRLAQVLSDAIAALEKLGGLIRDAAQLPKRRRKRYLDAVTEAFSMLQAAVVLVETRLGDLLHIQDDWELNDEQKRTATARGRRRPGTRRVCVGGILMSITAMSGRSVSMTWSRSATC
jgi:hypothetical protein